MIHFETSYKFLRVLSSRQILLLLSYSPPPLPVWWMNPSVIIVPTEQEEEHDNFQPWAFIFLLEKRIKRRRKDRPQFCVCPRRLTAWTSSLPARRTRLRTWGEQRRKPWGLEEEISDAVSLHLLQIVCLLSVSLMHTGKLAQKHFEIKTKNCRQQSQALDRLLNKIYIRRSICVRGACACVVMLVEIWKENKKTKKEFRVIYHQSHEQQQQQFDVDDDDAVQWTCRTARPEVSLTFFHQVKEKSPNKKFFYLFSFSYLFIFFFFCIYFVL